jgi:protein-S-isoprenylcysteine O-methyltransferase Ste14
MKLTHFLLVAIQFGGIFFFVITGKNTPENILVAFFQAFSIGLAFGAYFSMKRHTFSIMPAVRKHAQLCKSGPYRFIRHPMYTSVLMFLSALLMNDFSWARAFVLFIVFADLVFKIATEEKILRQKFAEYSDYMKHTRKIIPFVY